MSPKLIFSSKVVRFGCLALAVYSVGYVAARSSKLLVHRVGYDRSSVPNRYHLVGAGDFGPVASNAKTLQWAEASAKAVFRPLMKAEAVVWLAVPRSYQYDYRVIAPRI